MKRLSALLALVALALPTVAQAQTVRGTYETPAPTLSNGEQHSLRVDSSGALIVSGGGGGGSSAAAAQGSTTSGQNTQLDGCATVTGDQAYVTGTTNPLNCTPTGRLKVGVSSSGNVDPAAQQATTTEALLVACKNRATSTFTTGYTGALSCDTSGNLNVNNATLPPGAATSANQTTQTTALQALSGTVGTRGSTAPTTAQTIQGLDSGGLGRGLLTSTTGVLAAPMAGTAQSTGTVTSLASTTSTTICPATTNPVVYEVQIYGTGPVLLGLDGQTLTGTTPAAGSGAYMLLPTQYTLYVGPVARTNIITAYTATAQTVTCNIVTRQ